MKEKISIGIDVSKDHLDIHIRSLPYISFKVENSSLGINTIITKLSTFKHEINQIVCEATGGYEFQMQNMLRLAGYNVWSVNPRRVKSFIDSEGVFVKTDKTDARMLAMFAEKKESSYDQYIPTVEDLELRAAIKRRADIVGMLTMEKNRLKAPLYKSEKKGIKSVITFFEKQVKKHDDRIKKLIQENEIWKRKVEIIESIPGVGRITSTTLLSDIPELGSIGHKKAAALLGVAPYTKESGAYKGASKIKGGRPGPRKVVYMAALCASHSNPILKVFYQKLLMAGKKPKVALVAVMRKLIVMINAMLANDQNWNLNLHIAT